MPVAVYSCDTVMYNSPFYFLALGIFFKLHINRQGLAGIFFPISPYIMWPFPHLTSQVLYTRALTEWPQEGHLLPQQKGGKLRGNSCLFSVKGPGL